jgi:hypothetical protein
MSTLRSVPKLKGGNAVTVGASQTNVAISDTFGLSALDGEQLSIDIIHTAATVAAAITVKLQTSPNGGVTWIDSKTASTTNSSTRTSIEIVAARAADQTFLPLRSLARVVVTTGAGDSLPVTGVFVSRRVFN